MTVTREEARELLARLRLAGTAASAAYGCSVELRAIEPYTCGTLARVRHLLRTLERIEERNAAGEVGLRWTPAAWVAAVAKIAGVELCGSCGVEAASGPDGALCASCAAEAGEYVAALAAETFGGAQ